MRQVVFALIAFYQRFISAFLPPRCRYYPSCSQYAREAVEHHGVGRGLWLGVKRFARCHPFSDSGYDPVPLRFTWFQVPGSRVPGSSVTGSRVPGFEAEGCAGEDSFVDNDRVTVANSQQSVAHRVTRRVDQCIHEHGSTEHIVSGRSNPGQIEKIDNEHMLSNSQHCGRNSIESGRAGLSSTPGQISDLQN